MRRETLETVESRLLNNTNKAYLSCVNFNSQNTNNKIYDKIEKLCIALKPKKWTFLALIQY